MINFRFITNIIGKLLFVESAFLILCIIVALIYGENDLMAFVYSVIVTLGVGSLMTFTVKVKDRVLAKKDGYFIVTCTWIIFTIFGCLPYLFGGTIPSIVDAIFETMSGFTTTGPSGENKNVSDNLSELGYECNVKAGQKVHINFTTGKGKVE